MVNARQKGRTGELQVLNMLTRHTGLPFTQVPGSGSGKVKGDLYLEHLILYLCTTIFNVLCVNIYTLYIYLLHYKSSISCDY